MAIAAAGFGDFSKGNMSTPGTFPGPFLALLVLTEARICSRRSLGTRVCTLVRSY